jgi:hypothetical protein
MGRLTDEMTRLCDEIVTLRQSRQGFVKDLTKNVAAMTAGHRRARKEMGRKTRAARQAGVAHLRKTVGDMRHAFAADLEGARRAWAGK